LNGSSLGGPAEHSPDQERVGPHREGDPGIIDKRDSVI